MCQISRFLLWKSPQECQNVTIDFCFIVRIFYELRYTLIIEIVWTFYLKSVPAKFKKYSKHISWVISGKSSSKLSCNPRQPSRNIRCNHRHHLLQPSWRRIFSTLNSQKTRVDSDINSDYKASSWTNYISDAEKTQRALLGHQRKYWNALPVSRSHADDGCSCNHRAVPPSALANMEYLSDAKRIVPGITDDVKGVRFESSIFLSSGAGLHETIQLRLQVHGVNNGGYIGVSPPVTKDNCLTGRHHRHYMRPRPICLACPGTVSILRRQVMVATQPPLRDVSFIADIDDVIAPSQIWCCSKSQMVSKCLS